MKKWRYIFIGGAIYLLAIIAITAIEKNDPDANITSIGDALWYAIVTLTTVGYGDFFPVTPFGRIIGLTLIIGSIGILGFIISEITSRFNQYMEKKKNGYWGTDFKDHYLIIGWNDFGRQVADQILNTGHKVAFVVNSKNDLELIKDIFDEEYCFCRFADFNNMDAYDKTNINHSKGVFVNFSADTDTLVFVLNLKKAYPTANIVVMVNNSSLKDTFKSAGIEHIVAREEVAAKMVASYIFEPQVASLTEDLITTSVADSDFDIQQYKIIDNNEFIGKKYLDAFFALRQEFEAVVIGLVSDKKIIKKPKNDYIIKASDYLILISDGNCKKKLEKLFGIKEGH